MAIQLKLTSFKDDTVDIRLCDHSVNVDKVAERLRNTKIFRNVFFENIKYTLNKKKTITKILEIFTHGFGIEKGKKIDFYDEIIFYTLELPLYAMENYYRKNSHCAIWTRIEEGAISYNNKLWGGKRVDKVRAIKHIIHKPDVADMINKYYCLQPDVVVDVYPYWETVKIPSISERFDELKKILNYIFDYKGEEKHYKYIYFASASDIDGWPYGETELVLKIAETVGHDNLLVKTHPRDKRSVYKDNGLTVMENSNIPWEVIQFNLKDDDCVLLATTSGSFLNAMALMDKPIKGYFLNNCIKCNSDNYEEKSAQIHSILNKLHKQGLCISITEF